MWFLWVNTCMLRFSVFVDDYLSFWKCFQWWTYSHRCSSRCVYVLNAFYDRVVDVPCLSTPTTPCFMSMYLYCAFLLTIPKLTPTYSLQIVILAILVTRMHRHLWQMSMNQHAHSSGFVRIPMSDMSSANDIAWCLILWLIRCHSWSDVWTVRNDWWGWV